MSGDALSRWSGDSLCLVLSSFSGIFRVGWGGGGGGIIICPWMYDYRVVDSVFVCLSVCTLAVFLLHKSEDNESITQPLPNPNPLFLYSVSKLVLFWRKDHLRCCFRMLRAQCLLLALLQDIQRNFCGHHVQGL